MRRSAALDLIVIGGGPAGTTLATLVKRRHPDRRVLLLERCPGPRHHIGESLLPGLAPILKEMGVFEQVDAAGFPRKIGANYVWGASRKVWENDFNDANVTRMLARHGALPPQLEYAWQVRRSEYDEILLRHAERSGVEVRRGTAASSIIEGDEGSVAGVRLADGSELRCAMLADCSGQSGFLSRHRRVRRYNRSLRNVAFYSYFRGAPWKYRFSGHPDKTKIFVCSVRHGWFWYIPIARDVVSVGLVTSVDRFKKKGLSARELFFSELRRCAEIGPLLEAARPIEDFDGSGRDFFTQSDWSYLNVASSGPGWLAAGDAAVFVDPILSSGVTLAHMAGHRAAYTLMTSWREPGWARSLWNDYDLFNRESAAQFLALALFWYGNDRRARGWRARAQQIQRAWLPVETSDRRAFISVSAGLTRHYERLLSAVSLADGEPLRPADSPFYVSVLGRDPMLERVAGRAQPSGQRLRLLHPYVMETVFVPKPEEGRLVPARRVRFLRRRGGGPVADALNPRRVVTPYHLQLLRAIDGRRTFAQACVEAARRGVPAWWLERSAGTFVKELRLQGVAA